MNFSSDAFQDIMDYQLGFFLALVMVHIGNSLIHPSSFVMMKQSEAWLKSSLTIIIWWSSKKDCFHGLGRLGWHGCELVWLWQKINMNIWWGKLFKSSDKTLYCAKIFVMALIWSEKCLVNKKLQCKLGHIYHHGNKVKDLFIEISSS